MPNTFFTAIIQRIATIIAVLTIAACGGGGGGGGNPPPPTGNPPPGNPPPGNPPPSGGSLAIDQSSADILPLSLDLAQTALRVGRSAIDAVVPFSTPQGQSIADCSRDGSRSVTLQDADGNASVSVGDTLTIVFNGCRDRFLADAANGTVTVELVTFSLSPSAIEIDAVVTLGADFEITNGINEVFEFTGEFLVRLTHGDAIQGDQEVLTVSAQGAQFFAQTLTGVAETLTEFEITRRRGAGLVTPGGGSIEATLTFELDYDSEFLGGTAACVATQLDLPNGTQQPSAANVACSGANGSAVRVPSPDVFEVDPEGDGSFSNLGTLQWSLVFDFFINESAEFNLQELVPDLPSFSLITSAIDLAEDPTRGRIIALTDASDASAPNALVALDPVARSVTPVATLPEPPREVFVAPDGAFYYVTLAASGSPIIRIDAATGAQSASIDFATDFAPRGEVFVADLDVSPTDSLTIAVVAKSEVSGAGDVLVIDDTTARPNTLGDLGTIFIGALLSDVVFTSDGSELRVAANFLTAATLDANGIAAKTETNINSGTLRRLGADQLLSGGTVLNASTLVQEGEFLPIQTPVAAVDDSRYLLLRSDGVDLYRRDNYLLQGTYDLKTPFGSQLISAAALADTLAVADGERVFVYTLTDAEIQDDNRCGASTVQADEGAEIVRIQCNVTDIAYDSARDRLYIAVRELRQAVVGNSVAVWNPNALSGFTYAPVGDDPRRIAISSGGNELFVAFDDDHRIARLDLNSLAVTSRADIPVGPRPFQTRPDARSAIDIAASPIVSTGLAITFTADSGFFDGIAYFQDGVLGANVITRDALPSPTDFGARIIEFDDIGELVTVSTSNEFAVQRFTADGTGVVLTDTNVVPGFPDLPNEIDRLGTLVYGANGNVLDTVTGDVAETFDLDLATPFGARVAVLADPDTNSAYFLTNNGDTSVVARYDIATGALVGTVTFQAPNNISTLNPPKIIKMGVERIGVMASETGGIAVIDATDFE